MNILLTGAAGQLGSELLPLLATHGRVVATDRSAVAGSNTDWVKLDISDAAQLETLLARLQPDLIVNTAAYTAVDQAEADRETSFALNADLPGQLAVWAKRNDARLLHYSTDYVFAGSSTVPYLESDTPGPLNVYGESKLAGELAIGASGCAHATLRTSWVYSSHGKNFVLSMLNLARQGLDLKIVNDQCGCPTWARSLAAASNTIVQAWQTPGAESCHGTFHYCDDRAVSWYEFAGKIFSLAVAAKLLHKQPALTPVPSTEFPQPAKRPRWSVLDTQRIGEAFGIFPASFERSLQAVIAEIKKGGFL